MQYRHPEFLVSAQDLHAMLDDEHLRVFDTTVHLTPEGHGYKVTSGLEDYRAGHIPGAGFIDLADAWSDTDSELRFTLPPMDDLQASIGAAGIAPEDRVVLYATGHLMWATRAWWLLHHAGHSNIAILNGNLRAWQAAGYPLHEGDEGYPPAEFRAAPRSGAFADTETVEKGMHGRVCTLNALTRSLYEGTGDFYYRRRGHIPGSRLLYYDTLLDNEHFLPPAALTDALNEIEALHADSVITYCGGGIAATLDAFACMLAGQEHVSVYDGSMSEWVQDDTRPLTEGEAP